jgi:hypothetical protein
LRFDDGSPSIVFPDHREGRASALSKHRNGSVPIPLGQKQFAQHPHIAKEQGRPMPLARIGGTRRITDKHHSVAGNPARPESAVRKEPEWTLLLD